MTKETDLLATLEPFYAEELITEVLYVVKSGKEATVFCCRAHPATGHDLLAAKVYRPRDQRSFKDDSLYQQGRFFDKRMARAVAYRTRKGLAAMYSSWIEHEYATLHLLYHAGADIPRPLAQRGNAILMEYIGDGRAAAPPLARSDVPRADAKRHFDRLIHNIELWLAHDRVHGDLSAYNILYWQGEVKVIDFPQAVHPQNNQNAYDLLLRDVENVCGFWERFGIRSRPRRMAEDMWVRYQFGEL